jgi:2'-5' RNA ligase
LNSCMYHHSLKANESLRRSFNNTEQINFQTTSIPHVTLYLTEFQDGVQDEIIQMLGNLFENKSPIRISSTELVINGAYAMYGIENTAILKTLSDDIVLALYRYMEPDQVIPEWVYNLPEPTRSKKIRYVQEYGSPNVFDEFDPHVTVGYDEIVPSDERRKVLEQDWGCLEELTLEVGVGIVSSFGTVIQEVATLPLRYNTIVFDPEVETVII